jgi:hypothetical protein
MDDDLRNELIRRIRENLECLLLITSQIGQLTLGLVDAGDRMAQDLGQQVHALPLAPVATFLDEVSGSKDLVKEIMETIRLIGRNHTFIASTLIEPVVQ